MGQHIRPWLRSKVARHMVTSTSGDVWRCSGGVVQGGDGAVADPIAGARAHSRMIVPPSRRFAACDLMQIQGVQKAVAPWSYS
jgi:hypothetical protein